MELAGDDAAEGKAFPDAILKRCFWDCYLYAHRSRRTMLIKTTSEKQIRVFGEFNVKIVSFSFLNHMSILVLKRINIHQFKNHC